MAACFEDITRSLLKTDLKASLNYAALASSQANAAFARLKSSIYCWW